MTTIYALSGSESSPFDNKTVTTIWRLRARRWGGATVTKIMIQIRSPGTLHPIRIESGRRSGTGAEQCDEAHTANIRQTLDKGGNS